MSTGSFSRVSEILAPGREKETRSSLRIPIASLIGMNSVDIRSILVATDLQASSEAVLSSAAALAGRTGSEIHVLHALEILTSYSAMSAAEDFQRRFQTARDEMESQIRRYIPEGVRVASQQVMMESIPRAVLERAGEVEADLIVIGPATPRRFRGPILGNTADRIISNSRIPVLVIRDSAAMELSSVVVPLDVGDPARGALDLALVWAAALRPSPAPSLVSSPEVRVVYVIPKQYSTPDFRFDDLVASPQLRIEIEDAQERTGLREEVRIRQQLVWGDRPAEEIVRLVESEPTELLVLGTHGYGAIGRALIGSVTSRVVRAATCPMLLVPPQLAMTTAGRER
jgi:nucleotide-binding universal stress UspA family protein